MMKIIFLFIFCFCSVIKAQRIVSLSPSITYTLQQIGADQKIVGRTSYCPQAELGTKTTIIGDVLTINIEKIIALKPDIVYTMSFTSKQTIDKLKQLGIKVIDFKSPNSFEEICKQTLQIGEECNCLEKTQSIIAQEKAYVDSLQKIANNKIHKKIFFEIGARPLFGAAKGTFIDDYITKCGCLNINKEKQGIISREFVLSQHPDFIIISSMGNVSESELQIWSKLTKSKILLVDENEACCPTPIFFRKTLDRIIKFVTPNEK